jgi:hypothetical protein
MKHDTTKGIHVALLGRFDVSRAVMQREQLRRSPPDCAIPNSRSFNRAVV